MIEAAQHLGFEAKGVKGQWEALATIPLPAIAHVVIGKLLHYVVIHKVTEKKITVADPAKGIVSYTSEEFQKIWSGVLILLTPSATFRAGDKSISVWKRFARLLEPHDFLLAETFLASVFLMVLGLSFSIYLQLLVDKVIAEKNWTMLRWFSLGLVGVVICRAVLGMVRGAFLAYISQKVDVSLMLEYYRHVMKLPAQFFDTRQVGEIISRIGDAVRIREVTSGTTLTVLVDTATMLATFGILCFYSLKLAMLSLLLLPILGVLIHFLNRPLKKYQQATMEGAAGLQSHLVEGLSGVMTFKAFGAEDYVEFKTEKKLVKLLRNLFRATMWGVSASVAGELIIGLGLALIMWSAGAMVINDGLSIGQLVAFYSILLYLFQPMLRLVTVNQSIQAAVVAAERTGQDH